MERPKIEDFFPEGTGLSEAMKEFKKSDILFKYAQALDRYCDYVDIQIIARFKAPSFHDYFMKGLVDEKESDGLLNNPLLDDDRKDNP